MKKMILAIALAFPLAVSAGTMDRAPIKKLTMLGEAYRYVCEEIGGGEYVNDNPSEIQSFSCYLPERIWKPRG